LCHEYRMEISVIAKKPGSHSPCQLKEQQRNILKFTWKSRRRRMIQPESPADKRTGRVNLQCGCRLPVRQACCGDGRVAYASSSWYLLRCRDACRLLSLSLRLLYCPRPATALCVCGVLRWWSGGTAFHQLQVTELYSTQNDRCRTSVPPRSALLWPLGTFHLKRYCERYFSTSAKSPTAWVVNYCWSCITFNSTNLWLITKPF